MKHLDAPSAWSSPSDLDKKESDGRDLPQRVAPHAHRGVVGAPELPNRMEDAGLKFGSGLRDGRAQTPCRSVWRVCLKGRSTDSFEMIPMAIRA